MDSLLAFDMNQAAIARRARPRVFDWDQAARYIRENNPVSVVAGLQLDMEWTGGFIWEDGRPVDDDYTYLKSNWATPVMAVKLRDDSEEVEIPCWKYADETEWDENTKWPISALTILLKGE